MKRFNILLLVLVLMALPAFALKPKWVGNTPKELNNTYRFVEVVSYGNNIVVARENAVEVLAKNEQLLRAVTANVETGKLSHIDQKRVNGKLSETITTQVDINMTVKGEAYRLQAAIVDEYSYRTQGSIKLHTLYMVAVTDNPIFDRAYLTTNYGAAPIAMSIIPGLGQIYKGSTVKGISMFAGTALCAGGALLCENQRSDYKNKMKEQPQFAKSYNTKANNWETGRNICLGATAAVWIYNIIDAAAAKGARRVKVEKSRNRSLTISPIPTSDGAALSVVYQF